MYLIELSANKPSFHTIKFKEGLNFIVGGIKDKSDKEDKTYNGVGKSLLVKILHFCLGCRKIPQFEEKLNDWEFSLKFRIDNEEYTAKRKCSQQGVIYLNDKEIKVSQFCETIGNLVFNLNKNDYQYLTYRSLISRFIRPNKSSYDSYDVFISKEQEYSKNLCNSYLLGLSAELVNKKRELVSEMKKVTDSKKMFEKDETIKNFFEKDEKIDVSIVDLEQNINKLKNEIEQFKIADNYYDIKQEADSQQSELSEIENDILLLNSAIENVNDSLDIKLDISSKKIIDMYEEAKVKLNEMVVKEIEEVEQFHKKLIENRRKRLVTQKRELLNKKEQKEKLRINISNKLDKNLELLNAYGALEEYNALNSKLNQYVARLEKLNKYKELLEKYKNEINLLNIDINKENMRTDEYLKESKKILDRNIIVFRELTQRFYPRKTGGIQIENDEGDNLNRFKISADIEDDTSDGVNGVKIFCYDYTVLLNGYNHNVRFLFHDSRLFSDIDPRQKGECIKVANEYTREYGFQYIATLNEDFIDTIKGIYDKDSYQEIKEIIESNTILRLTDNNAEGKLLGIQLDLKYE